MSIEKIRKDWFNIQFTVLIKEYRKDWFYIQVTVFVSRIPKTKWCHVTFNIWKRYVCSLQGGQKNSIWQHVTEVSTKQTYSVVKTWNLNWSKRENKNEWSFELNVNPEGDLKLICVKKHDYNGDRNYKRKKKIFLLN